MLDLLLEAAAMLWLRLLCLCDFWLPDQSSRAADPRSSQFTTALHCWATQAFNERKLYLYVATCLCVW